MNKKGLTRGWLTMIHMVALGLIFTVGSGLSQTITQGNIFDMGTSSSTGSVTPTANQWVTFTATGNDTVSDVRLYNQTASTASPVLSIGIYAVDGAGKPTGSALASTTYSPGASIGWQTIALNYTMTQGTAYAIRVSTSTAGSIYPWRVVTGSVTNGTQPSGATDARWARGSNTGTPTNTSNNIWVVNTSYAVGPTTVAQATGLPYQSYTSAATSTLISTTNAVGQRFRFDEAESGQTLLNSINLKLSLSSPPAAAPLTVHLLDSAGNILTTGTLSLSGLVSGVQTVNFNEAIQLTDGAYYYFAAYVNSTGSSSGAILSGGLMTNDAVYIAASYQGADSYGVSWNSHSNFAAPTNSLTTDYYFGLNLSAVPEPSTVVLAIAGLMLIVIGRRRLLRS